MKRLRLIFLSAIVAGSVYADPAFSNPAECNKVIRFLTSTPRRISSVAATLPANTIVVAHLNGDRYLLATSKGVVTANGRPGGEIRWRAGIRGLSIGFQPMLVLKFVSLSPMHMSSLQSSIESFNPEHLSIIFPNGLQDAYTMGDVAAIGLDGNTTVVSKRKVIKNLIVGAGALGIIWTATQVKTDLTRDTFGAKATPLHALYSQTFRPQIEAEWAATFMPHYRTLYEFQRSLAQDFKDSSKDARGSDKRWYSTLIESREARELALKRARAIDTAFDPATPKRQEISVLALVKFFQNSRPQFHSSDIAQRPDGRLAIDASVKNSFTQIFWNEDLAISSETQLNIDFVSELVRSQIVKLRPSKYQDLLSSIYNAAPFDADSNIGWREILGVQRSADGTRYDLK